MTAEQRRITFVLCISVGFTFLISAGLTFLISPMAEDLDLGDNAVKTLLAVPSIASLIVIFIAGQAGDRLGHRTALLYCSIAFIVGSLLISAGEGVSIIGFGLAICGAAATAIQIVALGLLQLTVPEGRAHTSAFTSYGMVYPIAYLLFPILTAGILDIAAWRIVPVIWALAGVTIAIFVFLCIHPSKNHSPMGEWLSPLLAGAALAAGVRFLDAVGRDGLRSPEAVPNLIFLTIAITLFTLRYRSKISVSFSFEPLRGSMTQVLLLGVALVALVGTLTYVILALQFMFDMTPFESALAVVPAQAGAIVGAKVFASRAIQRWGYAVAGTHLTLTLGLAVLTLVSIQATSPAWLLVVCATAFNTVAMAAVTVLNADVMARAPINATGPVSSFRGAASSIGTGLGVVVLGSGVISAANVSNGTASVSIEQLEQIALALRIDGVVGCVIALIAWASLHLAERQRTSVKIDS